MLSLILPTYNESANLPVLLPAIHKVLSGRDFEVIIVDDDSPDLTWQQALRFAQSDSHFRVIRRIGRRGLSSAVIEGFLAATGDVLAVMDADGQHDTQLLTALEDAIRRDADLAIGSRYIEGGSVGTWDERRFALSRKATALAQKLCKVPVADPMSGFFAIRRETFEKALPSLNPKGFKILFDLLVHLPTPSTVREIPLKFGLRIAGESKLSRRVQVEFLEYLYDATIGRYIPLSFVKFAIVGLSGILINVSVYLIAQAVFRSSATELIGFSPSLLLGIEAAIIWNFLLHNHWTFSQVHLTGTKAVRGFIFFNIACVLGALANYAVTAELYTRGLTELVSLIVGAFIGMTWNYTMSRLLTWKV